MMGMMSGGWGNVRSVGYGLLPLGILGFVIAVLWHLFWVVLLILFVRWIYLGFRRKNFWGGSALSILKERYARGEINKEEFEAKKADINK
ncbi:SHOCT domain-containing protein [Candidatus Uhrbacteria bacterium]|nr:SHOCT domain-containing protein [Candidatus Uhrbacteria bacterium]